MVQFFAVSGSIMFHVRRRPADYHPRKRKKKPQQKWNKANELMEYRYEDGYDRLPFFLELNPGMFQFIRTYSVFIDKYLSWRHEPQLKNVSCWGMCIQM
jgi:hypothetical protein